MRRTKPRRSVALWAFAVSLFAWPALTWAHGGEDHGEPRKPVVVAGASPSASGTGDVYEVLVKYAATRPGQPMALRIFVADALTNAPVAGAQVELAVTATATELTVVAKAGSSAGRYEASVVLPLEGDYDTVATVTLGEEVDVVPLGDLRAGMVAALAPSQTAAGDAHDHDKTAGSWWPLAAAGLALLGLGLFGGWWLGRRRPHAEVRNA